MKPIQGLHNGQPWKWATGTSSGTFIFSGGASRAPPPYQLTRESSHAWDDASGERYRRRYIAYQLVKGRSLRCWFRYKSACVISAVIQRVLPSDPAVCGAAVRRLTHSPRVLVMAARLSCCDQIGGISRDGVSCQVVVRWTQLGHPVVTPSVTKTKAPRRPTTQFQFSNAARANIKILYLFNKFWKLFGSFII